MNPAHAGGWRCGRSSRSTPRTGRPRRPTWPPLRRTNPHDAGAARIAAAAALLVDDRAGYERERAATWRVAAADGAFFAYVAEALTRHRRYDDARDVAAPRVVRRPRGRRAASPCWP